MMHMRVDMPPHRGSPSRYQARRVDPVALCLALLLLAGLAVVVASHRYTFDPPVVAPPLTVQAFDLTPPPPPPSAPETPPPPVAIHVPKPLVVPPLPPRPQPVTVTPDPPPPQPQPTAARTAAETPAPAAAPPAPPRTVSSGDLSSSMIHAPPPRYPRESRRQREQGTVLLSVLLATDGTIAQIGIARSSGHRRLDEAARDAVRRWRWSPTVRGGVPVQVNGTVEIPFILTS